MNERQQKPVSPEAGEVKQPPRPDIEPGINGALADQIQRELKFRLQRAPENIVTKVGLVKIILILLQVLLLIHNNYGTWISDQHYDGSSADKQRSGALGYWPFFLDLSVYCREALKGTHLAHAARLDSPSLDAYNLWRGVVVPGFLSVTTYIVVSLLSLRHELYHWKPHLLQEYLESAKDSFVGRFLPNSWLDYAFHIYETKHRDYISHKLQKPSYRALDDAKQFIQILKTVGFNLLTSLGVLLGLWMLLLQTKLDTHDVLVLPRSYVPSVQFTAWYACNDFFYFYPHWIAHTKKSRKGIHYKFLPAPIADAIQKSLQGVHKAHHKSKAQLGVAAWYCSPWEQIFLNLGPAFIGPLLTQLLSEAVGVDHIWGTHLLILYIWLMAATASSVLSHTGYRSRWNDPGKHDLHHERAFDPIKAVNFGTMGLFDWLHGTASSIPKADALAWRAQRDRQAALVTASRRTGIALTREQTEVVRQPDHSGEWLDKRADE